MKRGCVSKWGKPLNNGSRKNRMDFLDSAWIGWSIFSKVFTMNCVSLLLLLTAFFAGTAAAEEREPLQRLSVATHIHSMISPSGRDPLQVLAATAKKKNIDVVIPTDHF